MQPNSDPFPWDIAREEAAQRLAEGELRDIEIAEKAGVHRATLWRWQQHPDFQARIEEHRGVFRAEVRRRGLADRERRIKALNDRWTRLQRLIEARADDPLMCDVPGGDTGLLVRTVKIRARGEGETETTIEAELDSALLKELREHEKQAAQELGQWVEQSKVEQTVKAYVSVSPDEM